MKNPRHPDSHPYDASGRRRLDGFTRDSIQTEKPPHVTADYASALNIAWDNIDCQVADECRDTKLRCKGHAALLEMAGVFHLTGCGCKPEPNEHIDEACRRERRRLRTSVGVSNG